MRVLAGLVFVLGLPAVVFSQGTTIGANTPPNPAAVLELQSSSQGFLMTRLTSAQRNAIVAPPAGLQIYNTDNDCVEVFFAQGGWKPLQCGCNAFPNAQFTLPSGSVNNPASISCSVPNMTYAWTFQNGSPASSASASNSVTWSNAGTYGVTLTLTDSAGCSASYTDSIVISNCNPFALTFTPCGATGRFGPDQTQCNNAYGNGVVSVSNGIQSWTVPQSGTYRIRAAGAKGGPTGAYVGGDGIILEGEFALTAGQVIQIAVGQMGIAAGQGGGGGGGSFVVQASPQQPLLIAGGGGGATSYSNVNGYNALATTSGGNSSTQYGCGSPGGGSGGTGGNGGTGGCAAAGGGYLTNGASGAHSADGGGSFVSGNPVGGNSTNGVLPFGGYGGGGAGSYSNGYGGGGGGYSGGGGGGWNSSTAGNGGGGGSFNAGANPTQIGFNGAAGFVTVTFVCP